ncbi:MAG TPA: hypothetical protein VGB09_12130 [Candidatus Binatia bacterium]
MRFTPAAIALTGNERGQINHQSRGKIFMNTALSIIEPTDGGILERLHKRSLRGGEERLMLAVLENATEDFQKYALATHRKGIELFQAAEAWILETGSPSFYSFENICEHLQLDAGYMRAGFMRWKTAKLNGHLKPCASGATRRSRSS